MLYPHSGRIIAACGVIAGLMLAACTPTPGPSATTGAPTLTAQPALTATATPFKSELVICASGEPSTLIGSTTRAGQAIERMVAPQAVDYGQGYTATASLLTGLPNEADGSLKRSEDGTLSVILHYRDGLVWSDGEPFKTADALLGLQVPPSSSDPAFEVLDAEEGNAMTLSVTLASGAEYPYVPPQPPLPSHILGNVDRATLTQDAYARLVNPSLGPYFVAEWAAGDHVLLQANPYHSPAPLIPAVRVRFIPDLNQLAGEIASGGCDVALDDSLGSDQVAALDGSAAKVYTWPGSLWDYVAFNTYTGAFGRTPFFADPRVRQAVAYAFDRITLAQQIWQGVSPAMDSWLPSDHWAYSASGLTHFPVDLAAAASLLDQAGWLDQDGDGVREYHGPGGVYSCQRGEWAIEEGTLLAPLLITTGDPLRTQIAEKLRGDLAQIGISVQVQTLDPAAMFDSGGPVVHRDFDLALLAAVTRPDPGGINLWLGEDVFLHPLDKTPVHRWQLEDRWLTSDQLVERLAPSNVPRPENDFRGQNFSGWCDEQADLAIVQANLSFDLAVRQSFYAGQQVLFTADVPVIPLFERPRFAASASYVCGIQPGSYDSLTWNIAQWYFDESGVCEE